MRQLPQRPESANMRALGQWYTEEQTGVVGTTLTLAQLPAETEDGVGLLLLFKNGQLLAPTHGAPGIATHTWERTTGLVGNTLNVFTGTPLPGVLVFKNKLLLDPSVDWSIAGTVITLTVASIAGDVWIVSYFYGGASSSGYTRQGSVLTLATAAIAADVFVAYYAYRS